MKSIVNAIRVQKSDNSQKICVFRVDFMDEMV